MYVEFHCYCGERIESTLKAEHDFSLHGEDMDCDDICCGKCGMKARVHVHVNIMDYGKELT